MPDIAKKVLREIRKCFKDKTNLTVAAVLS
jgi:hypothetical protein